MPTEGRKTHDIGGFSGPRGRERQLAALAVRQHGVVARRQLIARGFTERAVDERLDHGRLHRIHRGVYAIGHPRLTQRGRRAAAILACGPGALLSHLDAAAVWDLARPRGAVHVTTDARSREGHPGITLHRVRFLHRADRTRRDGFPVTSVARTLLDLAATETTDRLARVIEQAERLQLLELRALNALLARSRGRRGCGRLRGALADYLPEAKDTHRARTQLPPALS
jgi:predicted transcriptional regulator of viral defense system